MGISRAALACQPVAQLGAFWQNGTKSISLHQRKEEERGLFLFSHFWGKLSYMSGKIILSKFRWHKHKYCLTIIVDEAVALLGAHVDE